MTAKSKNLPCCDAQVYREGLTLSGIVGRPHIHSTGMCTRKGRVAMHHPDAPGKTRHFCAVHARMARDGFIYASGAAMDPNSRRAYTSGAMGRQTPSDHGKWVEGEAPAAPELTKAQMALLKRSARGQQSGRSKWVKVSGQEIKVGKQLNALGLGYCEKDDDGGHSFVAWAPGIYLAKGGASKDAGPKCSTASETLRVGA